MRSIILLVAMYIFTSACATQIVYAREIPNHEFAIEGSYLCELNSNRAIPNNGGCFLIGYYNNKLPLSLSLFTGYKGGDSPSMPILLGIDYIYKGFDSFLPYLSLKSGINITGGGSGGGRAMNFNFLPDAEFILIPSLGILLQIDKVTHFDISARVYTIENHGGMQLSLRLRWDL